MIAPENRFSGIRDCLKRVVAEQGVSALWRGNVANVIRYFPTQAINFACKDFYKTYLCPYNPKTQPVMFFIGNCASGGAAGATSLPLVYPLDVVRTRLAADVGSGKDREFSGFVDCLKKSTSKGISGVYKGFGISVVGIFTYRALYFGMFDTGKVILFEDVKKASFLAIWGFAQVVTLGTGIVCYPLDTVRRRLMMDANKTGADSMYDGTKDCINKIYRNEGGRAFFKGCLSNILRGTGGALVLVFYEKIQAYLKDTSESNSS